jgi:HAD superfamily hydrolase (TIGR01662 family)
MKDIVLVMGYNASGKSTFVKNEFRDYTRLNRDFFGGTINGIATRARDLCLNGTTKIVLDNTYPDRKSRANIIAVGKEFNIPVRCIHLDTTIEDATLNACFRMIEKHGRLLEPEELRKNSDPNMFPPAALFQYRKLFETPSHDEGFVRIDTVKFVRNPYPSDYTNKALILDYDGNLRDVPEGSPYQYPTKTEEVKVLPGRKEIIQSYKDKGYLLLGVSNQSGIAKGNLLYATARDCFEHTNKLLGFDIKYEFCPHHSPPKCFCYCRKPSPGLGALLINQYKLNPAECLFVGDQTSDETFAERSGFQFQYTDKFFKVK